MNSILKIGILQGTILQLSYLDILNSIHSPSFSCFLYAHILQILSLAMCSLQSTRNSQLSVKHLYLCLLLAVHIYCVLEFIKCFSSVFLFSIFLSHLKTFSSIQLIFDPPTHTLFFPLHPHQLPSCRNSTQ